MPHRRSPLIAADVLIDRLVLPPPPILLDCSFDLAAPEAAEQAFAAAHLPGARYLHLERDLSAPKSAQGPVEGGRHPLPSREAFALRAASWGITPDTDVIVYDQQGGAFAARAWWLLRWIGHPLVQVLDGGLAAWTQQGGLLMSGHSPADTPASPYPIQESALRTLSAGQLLAQLPDWSVLDARAPERFRGEVEPLDSQAGHIPGARNRFFRQNLAPDGRFKPASVLREEFTALGTAPERLVHQCGSGVTACHNLLAMDIAGLPGSALYPGSWSEWSADPARPVAKG